MVRYSMGNLAAMLFVVGMVALDDGATTLVQARRPLHGGKTLERRPAVSQNNDIN